MKSHSSNTNNQSIDELVEAMSSQGDKSMPEESLRSMAEELNQYSQAYEDQEVPNWDRGESYFEEPTKWWQWQGLPVTSMAFSFVAMMLVVFNVQFKVSTDGLVMSFGQQDEPSQEQQIVALMEEKLSQFSKEQQQTLVNYIDDVKAQQQQSNLQLASYIMSTSRQERQEDIVDVLQYINEQQKDDKFEQNMKFKQLEQAIYYQTSNHMVVDNISTKPAKWASEE